MRADEQQRTLNGIDHALGLASKLISDGKLFEAGEMLQKASEGIASLPSGDKRDELIRHYQLVKHAGNFRQTMRTVTDNLGLGEAAAPFASLIADSMLGGLVGKALTPSARAASVREQRRQDLGHMLFDEMRHALEQLDGVEPPETTGTVASLRLCMPLVLELGYDNPSCGKCGKPWSQHFWPTEYNYLTACPTVTAVHAHSWVEMRREISFDGQRIAVEQKCECGEARELNVSNDEDGRALLLDGGP